MAPSAKGGSYGSPSKRHVRGFAIYSETAVEGRCSRMLNFGTQESDRTLGIHSLNRGILCLVGPFWCV